MKLTLTEKQELHFVALYIGKLPLDELRAAIPPEMIKSILQYWELLGKSLDAFFLDKPNPIPSLEGVTEEFKNMMQGWVDYYLNLSVLLFKTEHLIRQEADRQGFSLAIFKRSDLIKGLVLEQCINNIALVKQSYWESLGKVQNEERSRDVVKLFEGKTIPKATKTRWEQEEKKLIRSVDLRELMPLTNFCAQIFMQQHHLPEAKKWLSYGKTTNFSKFVVKKGVPEEISVRGKNKQ